MRRSVGFATSAWTILVIAAAIAALMNPHRAGGGPSYGWSAMAQAANDGSGDSRTPGNKDGDRSEQSTPEGRLSIDDLERAAQAVVERIGDKSLSFDADFENGSVDSVVRQGRDWYHINLRQDTWYRFFFRVKGCRDRELIFEFTCRNINAPAFDEGKGRWLLENGTIVAPLVSYDGKTWQPVDFIEKHGQDPGKYRFKHRFSANEAYLSHHHPYTYTDMLTWLKPLRNEPRVTLESLGRTRNGFLEPVLTIASEPRAKDLVVLIGREDADEITGSWGIEGLVRTLLSPDMRELLHRFTFKIVPMVGIDGVVAGAHHSAGYGYGGKRWHEEPAPPEIQNVKAAMRQWAAQGYRLKLAGKLHGIESFVRGDDKLCDGILTPSSALQNAVYAGLERRSNGFWKKTRRDVTIRPKGFFERFVLDEFGLFNVFGTHITGMSPDEARRGGEWLMYGIGAWLQP